MAVEYTILKEKEARLYSDMERVAKEMEASISNSDKFDELDREFNSIKNEHTAVKRQISLIQDEDQRDINELFSSDKEKFSELRSGSNQKVRVYDKGQNLFNGVRMLSPQDYISAHVFGPKNDLESRSISTSDGQTLQTIFAEEFIDLSRKKSSVFNAGVRTIPFEGDSIKFTKVTSDFSPAWVAENGAISDSDPGLTTVSLGSKKLVGLTLCSWESDMDSVNLSEVLYNMATQKFAEVLDNAMLEGTGAPAPTGAYSYSGIGEVKMSETNDFAKWSAVRYSKLMAALSTLGNEEATALILSPRSYYGLYSLVDTLYQPLQMSEPLKNVPILKAGTGVISDARTIDGSNEFSTGYIGDFRQIFFGLRKKLQLTVLKERYSANGQIGALFTLYGDFAAARESALVKLTGIQDEDSTTT